ncbi:MAG: hypothetical protein HONBIEJF_00626 [Fimbriimonadaceae bacterium]|nr:hypothetical protein [Fimbriimonadaceae bacterium]
MQSAARVGLLVSIFVVLFVAAYAILGRSVFAPKVKRYYALFDDAGGLTTGARVLLSGVKVGQVGAVELTPERKARVVMELEEKVAIPQGSIAALPTSLIGIGDRYVEIVAPAGVSATMAPGETMIGKKIGALDALMPDSKKTIEELNGTLAAARRLLEDGELRKSLQTLIDNSAKTADNFGKLAARIDVLVAESQATLASALRQGEQAVANLNKVTAEVYAFTKSGKVQGQVTGLLDDMRTTVRSGQQLVADMNALVNDPALRQPLNDIMANARTMSESGTKIAANAEKMSSDGVEITGKASQLADKALVLADKINGLADDLKDLLGKAKGAVEKIGGQASRLGTIDATLTGIRETKPNRNRAELDVTIPYAGTNYHIGLYDAFESNKLNFQIGKPFGKGSEFRYGVYAGTAGLGVDYLIAPKLMVRSDVYGINKPRFDLRAALDIGQGVSIWAGLDKVFDRNAPVIGVSIRK